MTTEEIKLDRAKRHQECQDEIEAVLKKYDFALSAEDYITPAVKITVQAKLMDFKKYDADVAEPANNAEPLTETNK